MSSGHESSGTAAERMLGAAPGRRHSAAGQRRTVISRATITTIRPLVGVIADVGRFCSCPEHQFCVARLYKLVLS